MQLSLLEGAFYAAARVWLARSYPRLACKIAFALRLTRETYRSFVNINVYLTDRDMSWLTGGCQF